jgi:hypothetical protein
MQLASLPMSPIGPSCRIAALQFFGRNWGHSGYRDAREPEGSVAFDPMAEVEPSNSL